ncbi:MAG: hypothetical protein IJS81_00025 [Selenomonadaceae bacterium]|nr:hypothetical protein [Selenomonadaceae bacterium]MBQ7628592.1 hypothetical protein [Selenomonadaceae bacterium]
MEKYYPYPCKRCGSCCRHVDCVDGMQHLNRGDGVCINLTENNLCKIYATRPPICNGKFLYENFYSHMTVADFHKMTSKLCKKLREMKA